MPLKADLLNDLNDSELRAVIERSNELLAERDRQRKEKALEDARVILAGAGLSLKDVASGKTSKGNGKGPVYHAGKQYQHPANKTLVWSGKGQKPTWLRELEGQGGKAVEVGNG
jgi:DNA-binding protein H-NS